MEPITTTAIISTIVGYLAKTIKENKTFDDFTKDFTSATINWIRPLFIRDDKPNEVLEKLTTNPESETKQKMAQTVLESELEDNPKAKDFLQEMYEKLTGEKATTNTTNSNSSGINTGTLIQVAGDSNQVNK